MCLESLVTRAWWGWTLCSQSCGQLGSLPPQTFEVFLSLPCWQEEKLENQQGPS